MQDDMFSFLLMLLKIFFNIIGVAICWMLIENDLIYLCIPVVIISALPWLSDYFDFGIDAY